MYTCILHMKIYVLLHSMLAKLVVEEEEKRHTDSLTVQNTKSVGHLGCPASKTGMEGLMYMHTKSDEQASLASTPHITLLCIYST